MENSKLTGDPAWVYKSEPSSHFVTDIYLPSVRLQQRAGVGADKNNFATLLAALTHEVTNI